MSACVDKKAECKALLTSVEQATAALRSHPDAGSDEEKKAYHDRLLAARRVLSEVSLADDELTKLREAAVKNISQFVYAHKDITRAQDPSELETTLGKATKAQKGYVASVMAMLEYCSAPGAIAPTMGGAAEPSMKAMPASPAASAETWTTFRHPTLAFEAAFFKAPEVGERRGPNSITHAAIADDGRRRMFSIAHITFPSPPTYACETLLTAHVDNDPECRRTGGGGIVELEGRPTLEATRVCNDGATQLKRVRCISEPEASRATLFDAQAHYSFGYDAKEARRFLDSARLR
jgi:hypothetical protein